MLDRVAEVEAIGKTKRGKIVGTPNPIVSGADDAEAFKRGHAAQLLSRPAMNISRGTRDKLYDG